MFDQNISKEHVRSDQYKMLDLCLISMPAKLTYTKVKCATPTDENSPLSVIKACHCTHGMKSTLVFRYYQSMKIIK